MLSTEYGLQSTESMEARGWLVCARSTAHAPWPVYLFSGQLANGSTHQLDSFFPCRLTLTLSLLSLWL